MKIYDISQEVFSCAVCPAIPNRENTRQFSEKELDYESF